MDNPAAPSEGPAAELCARSSATPVPTMRDWNSAPEQPLPSPEQGHVLVSSLLSIDYAKGKASAEALAKGETAACCLTEARGRISCNPQGGKVLCSSPRHRHVSMALPISGQSAPAGIAGWDAAEAIMRGESCGPGLVTVGSAHVTEVLK